MYVIRNSVKLLLKNVTLFLQKVLPMPYFNTKDVVAVAMSAAYWAILNNTLSPLFWRMTHLPFLCDFLAMVSLIIVAWWTRKFGAVTITGLLVSALTLMLQPNAFQMLGFIAASFLFDVLTRVIGYKNVFDRPLLSTLTLVAFSIIATWIAGLIIASIVMNIESFAGILTFSGLHAIGGLLGSIIGVIIVRALNNRMITTIAHK